MPCYILNWVPAEAAPGTASRERVAERLRLGMWGIGAEERHRDALVPGDPVLVYLGAPEREFLGRAELASAVHEWTPSEARVYPGDSSGGALLADVEEWDPPVPMDAVLLRLGPTAGADFAAGVVLISEHEYETVLAVAAELRVTG